jgi:hypothetical protein
MNKFKYKLKSFKYNVLPAFIIDENTRIKRNKVNVITKNLLILNIFVLILINNKDIVVIKHKAEDIRL